ncbi:hypothetical protein Taro_019339 [Colocasia esculenta]|uniref:Uncharacterized protein n=1 Tax=Colocasia esculenta TaxID=4460 RepID=A0A843UT69_COLES|nr:hypothetical protein [Colocasia esculenta]
MSFSPGCSVSLMVSPGCSFPTSWRTVGCCPGEGCSQDYFRLVSVGCSATSGLRYAFVVLAGAFWWVSQNSALVVLVEILPGPAFVAFTALLAAVFLSIDRVVWLVGVHSGEGSSQDHPLSLLAEVFPRSARSTQEPYCPSTQLTPQRLKRDGHRCCLSNCDDLSECNSKH